MIKIIKRIREIDWNKLRIRSRRDWAVFWVFAALVCYAAGVHYAYLFDRWLFQFSNPYMAYLNQPYTWEQLISFLILFAAVAEVVLFLCKKPVKAKILVLTGALLMPMVILAGYRLHTNLIVSSLWKEEPERVIVVWTDDDAGKKGSQMELAGEEKLEILELCRNLTPVSDEETQEILRQWYMEDDGGHFMQDSSIRLYFPEKFGHSYNFWLKVCDGKVYLWRGYNSSMEQELTFFEDNGIAEWIGERIASGTSQTAQK